jgi:3-phenylpropionate/trans-cinnamate dioxygenase ferredoxin reductase component
MPAPGILIIGGGESGASAARSLRKNGWRGALTLLGEEALPPYERPPLSKSALTDEGPPSPVCILDPARVLELEIAAPLGVEVLAIDPHRHIAITRAHGEFAYDRLVLATGASARPLLVEGGEHALTLRTFKDALALRGRLQPGSRLVVVGGGFIGLEVAASARKRGVEVTVLEAADRLLSRAVPADLAERLAARHSAEGVALRLGCALARIGREIESYVVEMSDGERLTADLVVAGIGSSPRTELAVAAGIETANGVSVDGALRTSAPDIFAIGDCCSFPHPLYGGRRLRLESWRNAQEQGDFVGRSLLGDAGAFEAVPWFWSDQYDWQLQIAGLPSEGAMTIRRDLGDGASMDFALAAGGRLVGMSALGEIEKIGRDARIADKLIAARAAPDITRLGDPRTKLKALLPA